MQYFRLLAALIACSTTLAAPAVKNPFKRAMANGTAPSDIQVLQYALVLEHLEATFYKGALEKYAESDFAAAGFPSWVRGRVSEVAGHEQTHVNFLTDALGNMSFPACDYSFPYTDVKSFLVLACGLENIGTSAYLGAAQYIKDPAYLTAAAAITTVEARHQSFFYAPVLKQAPWTGPFDTPMGLDMVYTLAAQLITSCPSSNPMLPVMAFPPLAVLGGPIANVMGGATIELIYNGSTTQTGTTYAALFNGLGQMVYPITNGSVTLPAGLQGYSYILVTSASDWASVDNSNIIAGPAELQSSFASGKANPGFMNPYGA